MEVHGLARSNRNPRPKRGVGQAATLLVLQLTILAMTGCGSGSSESAGPSNGQSSEFVLAADKLPRALTRSDVVLLSAQSAIEISNPGFVNNAVPVDVDAITSFGQQPGAFTDYSGWAQIFGSLGISAASTVIVYDDGEMKFASRVRFLVHYFGARRTYIVNGGYNALLPLIADGQLTETQPGTPASAIFDVTIHDSPIHLVQQEDVAAVLGDPQVTLLDVRTQAEYDGCLLLPGITRGGHIPGARNLPVEQLLEPQSSDSQFSFLQSPPSLFGIFFAFDLLRPQRIIVYCQDGAKSSLAATALIDAGYIDVSLYYLSYLDWQDNPSNPVESIGPCNS
jgi:thiosulfate/3-mercaptopyruvate sulfurtransferase